MPSSVDNYGIACKPVTSKASCFKLKHKLLKALKATKNVSKRYYELPNKTKTDTNRPPIELGTEIAYSRAKQKNSPTWTKKFNQGAKARKKGKVKMIKPLADRIVVKPAEAEQKTSSGLFIPDNAKEKPMQGKVVAVGPGRKNDKGEVVAMEVKVGDVVLYGKYSGTEVSVDGENYLIVKESDVIATL